MFNIESLPQHIQIFIFYTCTDIDNTNWVHSTYCQLLFVSIQAQTQSDVPNATLTLLLQFFIIKKMLNIYFLTTFVITIL